MSLCSSKQQLSFLIFCLYWEISFVSSYIKEVWGFEHQAASSYIICRYNSEMTIFCRHILFATKNLLPLRMVGAVFRDMKYKLKFTFILSSSKGWGTVFRMSDCVSWSDLWNTTWNLYLSCSYDGVSGGGRYFVSFEIPGEI